MESNHKEHIQSYRELAVILVSLIILTVVTVAVSRLDLGPLKIATALLVASTKATLVLLFFMQIREAGKVVTLSFAVTIIILAIFIGFIFFDVAYR